MHLLMVWKRYVKKTADSLHLFIKRLTPTILQLVAGPMGGGGAQLAAKMDPRIKAVLAITPWLYKYTLSASDLNHNSPVFNY